MFTFWSFITIHACDRWTDRQMDKITTPKTALAYAHAVKNNKQATVSGH